MTTFCYCIALRKAARKITSLYDDVLSSAGVNTAQFSLLKNIEKATPLSLTDLSKLTELDRSTVGRNVKILQRLGLVIITESEDQREAALTLTPQGIRAVRNGSRLWLKAQEKIEARLGHKNALQLRELLDTL
jgi:DNA-binding MarR family transcriptional regulator